MAKILILAETNGRRLKTVCLEILSHIDESHQRDILIFGDLSQSLSEELARYGANQIICLKSDALKYYSPEGHAEVMSNYIKEYNYDYIFSGSTALGKDLLPRVSGLLQAGMISEVTEFHLKDEVFTGVRPLFSGKCLTKVQFEGSPPYFVTVRSNAMGLSKNPVPGPGTVVDVPVKINNLRLVVQEIVRGTSQKLDLTEAHIIISGGRALKSAQNFKILEDLADVLNASVGASRAAVDAGFAPHAMQVGQTGKTVAPSLYIACGISGAIQHLAGMRTSHVIVAINTDPEAPIFSKADYGIIGDLFKIVPLLTEEFKTLLN